MLARKFDMDDMFCRVEIFNRDLKNWVVSSVTTMKGSMVPRILTKI